ncbi:hypothetical protein PENSPDRAFT_590832 [Peniophora sp. CONT]|nr:hypothetical protein PENSPDRAFT_590832 [Peniophora sp. CONT]
MSSIPALNELGAQSLSGGDPALEELYKTSFYLTHVLQVYTSAMMAVAVWDWITCLPMEWERIWKKDWSAVKCLYLWVRYYGLLCFALNLWLFNANFTVERCKTLHYLIASTCMWVTLGSEAILAIRTWAFLMRSKFAAVILSALLFGEMVFLLYVAIAGVYQVPILIGDSGPCTASDKPGKHVVSGFWLAPVAMDLICTAMTLYKVIAFKRITSMPLIRTFVREGVFYFLAVAAVNVLNAAFMFQKNASIQYINCFLALILSQVLCCRLVLNLRGQQNTGLERSMLYTSNVGGKSPGASNNNPGAHAISLQSMAFNHDTCAYDGDYVAKNQDRTQSDSEHHPIDAKSSENV